LKCRAVVYVLADAYIFLSARLPTALTFSTEKDVLPRKVGSSVVSDVVVVRIRIDGSARE
jgi:hypothetical protein